MGKKKLVLGTVQFGLNYGINNTLGKPTFETVTQILDCAFKHQVKILDTAEAYGNAHDVIGSYHTQSIHRFEIITKFSSAANNRPSNWEERIKLILRELNVSYLYGYMFHSFKDFKTYFKDYEMEILHLKSRGLIKKFGVSVYTNEELKVVIQTPNIDLIQLPFNLLDNYSQRGELLTIAKEKGIEIHSRSVFLQGLFFKNPDTLKQTLQPLKPYLEVIKEIANQNRLDINALSIAYVLQQSLVDSVLIGVDSVSQLLSNLDAANMKLSKETMKIIDSLNVSELALLNPSNWN
jgi:aryl-alcohol dehydrogenase-like predicted oxidoreductase